MRLLIIIGAGASFDSWPKYLGKTPSYQKLPLAKDLFSSLNKQNSFLEHYNLMSLAGWLRRTASTQGDSFDIEEELEIINNTATNSQDLNTLKNLFKTRFYLHSLINELNKETLNFTSTHTIYVDLINQFKKWIDQSPTSRFVDIVTFNYDILLEKAMETVYSYDWYSKNQTAPLSAYYSGKNIRIFKPHGSINWGKEILKGDNHFTYTLPEEVFREFNKLELTSSFQFIDPDDITDPMKSKIFIPAIAVPFKEKTTFNECPQEMLAKMLNTVKEADKIITLGWKGSDRHFTTLLKENNKVDEIYIVSPKTDTELNKIFPQEKFKLYESTFSYFVGETDALESILSTFDSKTISTH